MRAFSSCTVIKMWIHELYLISCVLWRFWTMCGLQVYTSKASYTRARWMVREPNASMCGRDCETALCCLWMVRILFAKNQNLSVFCANTENWMRLHALGVLCSPQVHRKLINSAPHANGAARLCVQSLRHQLYRLL